MWVDQMRKLLFLFVIVLSVTQSNRSIANDINLICRTHEINDTASLGSPVWTAEISITKKELLWSGPSNAKLFTIRIDDRRFKGEIECVPGVNQICLKTRLIIDRLTAKFLFVSPNSNGSLTGNSYEGKCEKSDLKKKF